jgi:hypothetical protein
MNKAIFNNVYRMITIENAIEPNSVFIFADQNQDYDECSTNSKGRNSTNF